MNKKILHLTLIRKPFDMIINGEKIEEYRERKDYWKTRLENREYDEIYFKNGYSKDAPFMRIEYEGLRIEENRYVILLGKILEVKNY